MKRLYCKLAYLAQLVIEVQRTHQQGMPPDKTIGFNVLLLIYVYTLRVSIHKDRLNGSNELQGEVQW